MARGESDGESSGSGRESSSSGEESEPKGKISEYEKQRFSRIAENKARLDALGISKAAKALVSPSPISKKRRVKRNSGEEDDDYTPGNADHDDDDDDDEDDDEDEEFLGNSACVSRKRKAIALSLQDSVAGGSQSRTTPTKTMRNDKEAATLKKKTPDFMSKMQMTQDELVIYFCQFDEAGKGFITLRDVAKMATVHDFTWTEEELQDMIRCFDMDKDGKLSLDEFRKIVSRCRMLKES
ncbi:EF-hand domain pair [Arabidopsis thaliana x Arabidopsis arenosa]|uniref:EF-hand domain pair n=1 Tax=Arabidopsis thaliana x Arabidopsis arenosa TaxID=1240361 RepID=A0A8T1Z5H9_9BRAS|nr:EF-hand domain pair [Arabidopsis thaliana x Arabidopsis arenosa]